MEIIKPSVELLDYTNPVDHVARCARICYASDKTTDNQAMYDRLRKSNHNSMFRHESIYYIIPYGEFRARFLEKYMNCQYVDIYFSTVEYVYYVVTNKHFIIDNPEFDNLNSYIIDVDTFKNTNVGKSMVRYTFKVITQISTSRELNRVSPNNIAEQSTRYVNLSKKGGAICQPHWMNDDTARLYNKCGVDECLKNTTVSIKDLYYLSGCEYGFNTYNELIEINMKPEDARGVLPLDTATVCVYTYSIKEWSHIIDLRYYGKTGKPHPNAKIIAGMIKDKLNEIGVNI